MEIKKLSGSLEEQAEKEVLAATVKKQKETIEKHQTLLQYVAEMTDVYIPEEEENEDVQNSTEITENV